MFDHYKCQFGICIKVYIKTICAKPSQQLNFLLLILYILPTSYPMIICLSVLLSIMRRNSLYEDLKVRYEVCGEILL